MILRRFFIFILIIILLGIFSFSYPYLAGLIIKENYEIEKCFVNKVIDGDTLVCNNETIRLLGINTPEKGEFYYSEAKDFLNEINNKEVGILRDFDDLDKYKRELKYIFYKGRLINVEILERGLGRSFMAENLKYEKKLRNAEEFAKENKLGLWTG